MAEKQVIDVVCIALPDGSVRWQRTNIEQLHETVRQWQHSLSDEKRKLFIEAGVTTGFVQLKMREEDFEQLVKNGQAFDTTP